MLRLTVPLKPLRLVKTILDDAEAPCLTVSDEGLAFMVKSGPVALGVAVELRRDTASRTKMEIASSGMDRMVMFFDIGFSAPYSRGNEDKPFFCTRQERSCTECAPHHRDYSCNLRKERDCTLGDRMLDMFIFCVSCLREYSVEPGSLIQRKGQPDDRHCQDYYEVLVLRIGEGQACG